MCVGVLHLGDLLAGQADGVDLIGECDWPSHVQQSDVTVQIFLPVVLWVDDDFVDGHNQLSAALKPGKFCKYLCQSRYAVRKGRVHYTCRQEVLRCPVVFSQTDQYVAGGEVLVPGRVEDAVSCGEDPFVTDQTGSTQQLLWTAFVQHHLPADSDTFSSFKQ